MQRRRTISALLDEIDERVADGGEVTTLFRTVGSKFNISASTLRYHYYKRGGHFEKSYGRQLLTDDQSAKLELIIIAFSVSNSPIQVSELSELAEIAFGVKVSQSWAHGWMKKRKKIFQPRKAKYLADVRNS